MKNLTSLCLVVFMMMGLCSCQQNKYEQWLENAQLQDTYTKEELYQRAKTEDTLVVYSVSSRVFDVKESFEKEYPGLTVEVRDVRGNDVVTQLQQNDQDENYACDLVICSDNDGTLYKKLIEPGIIYPYIPYDIAPKMKEGHADGKLSFLGEALMMFYNQDIYDKDPIDNIWQLTQDEYKGKIIMANPLRSFSTYGFSAMLIHESEQVEQAYEAYAGKKLELSEGETAGELLWRKLAANVVFTNSSDEVAEGIGNTGKDGYKIGIMISSKLRLRDIGYHFAPMYKMKPFSAVYTPNDVMMVAGSKNVNAAKLFIRYLLGETDGTGEGIKPYSTLGTWSTRTDVADGNDVPLSQMDVIELDNMYIYQNQSELNALFEKALEGK